MCLITDHCFSDKANRLTRNDVIDSPVCLYTSANLSNFKYNQIVQDWGIYIHGQLLSLSPRMTVIALLTGMGVIIPDLDRKKLFLSKIIKRIACIGKY